MIKNGKGGANTKKILVLNDNTGKIKFFNINKYWSQNKIEDFLFLEKDLSQNNTSWSVMGKK